jgi:excinuclease ABC subunit C
VPGFNNDDRAYLIRRGRVREVLPVPNTPAERSALSNRAADVFAPQERKGAPVPAHEVDELMLLSSWFRKYPHELDRTVPPSGFPRVMTA